MVTKAYQGKFKTIEIFAQLIKIDTHALYSIQ